MTAFEAYEMHCALKLHFQSDTYDYMKFKGKANVTPKAFERRSDRFTYKKLARQKDLFGYLLANMVDGSLVHVHDLASDDAEEIYKDWLRRRESLSYVFKNDLLKLKSDFDSNIKIFLGQKPHLYQLYRARKITPETMVILDSLCGIWKYWDKHTTEDLIYPSTKQKLQKYSVFFEIDKEKYGSIVKETFLERHLLERT